MESRSLVVAISVYEVVMQLSHNVLDMTPCGTQTDNGEEGEKVCETDPPLPMCLTTRIPFNLAPSFVGNAIESGAR